MSSPSESASLRALRCPLCGGPNGCEPARTGSFDSPCWCTEVRIAPEVLERIPEDARDRACLCRRCATGGESVGDSTPGPR